MKKWNFTKGPKSRKFDIKNDKNSKPFLEVLKIIKFIDLNKAVEGKVGTQNVKNSMGFLTGKYYHNNWQPGEKQQQ